MDRYYSTEALLQFQIEIMAAGAVIFCLAGLVLRKRRTWLSVTAVSWIALLVYYCAFAPWGIPI
ncbi:hypothetical protein CD178_03464 (plasmid) [Komagataeibacter saccharivorans]|uniref:Uncharacterized protein n=1 Tax=Komagataeibacter saccharivorans TaxID=265959 RepID=A0A347WH65_9PROT|nr:hypothetical protein CD178_03464 [Komagataeibacter saccharivorans]